MAKITNSIVVKVGDKVKALMRTKGRGKHIVRGNVWEVESNGDLPGTWVSIRVEGGDMTDPYVIFMANGKYNVMVPINDVLLVY